MHAGKSQCMPGSPPRAAARSRQACRQIPVHARRARGAPGAARPATPAELVAVALSPLSCSREPRTLPAAFLVVRSYWPHALVAAGSVEQALSNKMGGARLLPAMAKTAPAPDYRGRASGLDGRAIVQPWVMVSYHHDPARSGVGWARICSTRRPRCAAAAGRRGPARRRPRGMHCMLTVPECMQLSSRCARAARVGTAAHRVLIIHS